MRVLLISEPLFPSDGTSSRTINFAKALSSKGHEVYIITPNEAHNFHRNINGINIHRLKTIMPTGSGREKMQNIIRFLARGGLIQLFIEINKLYDPNKPTIVHYVNYYMSICGLIIEKLIKIKSIHDIQASAFLESTDRIDRIMMICLEKICSSSKNMMFVTTELRNYFVERYALFKKKTFVVPLSIDANYSTLNNDVREKLKSSYNFKYLIVYHGAAYPANIETLKIIKEIVERLNEEEINCKALILGFVGKYVSSPYFIICGYVEDLKSYISAADLAILPFDRGSLGMRARILDYMSCGVPVFALSKGLAGYTEAINQNSIIVANTKNELVSSSSTILTDITYREKIAGNSLRYIQDMHSPSIIEMKLKLVYESVIKDA